MWIRVEAGIARRKVTYRLTEALMSDEISADLGADVSAYVIRAAALGFLVALWGAVAEHSTEGRIADVPDLLLEEWAGWHGTPRLFARWVREHHTDEDGRLRDWDETNGPLDTRRESNRRAARAHREREKSKSGRKRPVSADVSTESGINERTNETNEQIDSPSGESAPSKSVALRDRSVTGITTRLGALVAEIRSGARERLTAEQQRKAYAMIVFTYWAAKCAATDRVLFDKQREARLVTALREGGDDVSEMFYAIDGALREPWHNGRKTGEKHLGIEYIFRNRAKIEELAALVHGYAQQTPHPEAQRYVAAMANDDSDSKAVEVQAHVA